MFLLDRCIKAALLPQMADALWETQSSSDLKNPQFCQVFRVGIPESRLLNKTLQANVWSLNTEQGNELLVSSDIYDEDQDQLWELILTDSRERISLP